MTTVTCVGRSGATMRRPMESLLTPAIRVAVREATNRWIKTLRLVPYDGMSMRQRFTYRTDSLWWFTELYLQKTRQLEAALEVVMALDALRDEADPCHLTIQTSSRAAWQAARAFGEARGLPVECDGAPAPVRHPDGASRLTAWAARMSRLKWRRRAKVPRPAIAAFVHRAFWRPHAGVVGESESYIGPVLRALAERIGPDELAYVGVGPRRNFRARRWWDPLASRRDPTGPIPIEALSPLRALAPSLEFWRRRHELASALTAGAAIRDAARVNGCDLWPVLEQELIGAALLQWPWSARAMDEAGAALDRLAPDVVLTYAEAGGWGRALVLEARRRGVPSVGIQHGFIYRHWLNYLHEPDEWTRVGDDPGVPAPDRTLLFDRYAAQHLHTAGAFPGEALAVTGSARLDELAAKVTALRTDGLDILRRSHMGDTADRLTVFAAKFSEVRLVFPEFVEAVAACPAVRLIIKPHPAETAEIYEPFVRMAPNIRLAAPTTDLASLLAGADAIITMNSTVAVDAMSIGVPALVIGLPNNLSPFVEAGVMTGSEPGATHEALVRLLYDESFRQGLLRRAAAFVDRYEMQADGKAASRGADVIAALMANRPDGACARRTLQNI